MRSFIIALLLLQVIANIEFHLPDIEGTMDFLQMSAYHHYPTQEHFITTQDGYILRVFRIQSTQIQSRSKVVFWQHGLLDSAAGGLCNDQHRAPIYMLADRGYDVWVGNSRGNIYSRNHTQIHPNTQQFWDFTFADMAQYDIPAVLTYINKMTSQKIHYIGHSQGTTQMFAALSKQYQGVRDNLLSYHALAPVAFLTQQKQFQILASIKQLPAILQLLGINEITSTRLNEKEGRILCALLDKQCLKLVALLMDFDSSLNNKERVDVMISHFLAGTSVKNILHWRQLVLNKNFVEFDGTPYNLDNINIRVHMYVGTADKLGDVYDNQILRQRLQQTWYKEYELGHSSFLLGKDMNYMLDLFENIESA